MKNNELITLITAIIFELKIYVLGKVFICYLISFSPQLYRLFTINIPIL